LKKATVQRTVTAMLTRIKDKISRMAQRTLGIEDIRFRLNVNTSKLDAITSKLDAISSNLDINTAKLDAISSNLDINTAKLDAITSKLDAITSKLDAISSNLDINTAKLDAISSKLDVSTNRLAEVDPKLQNLVERSDSLFWQIRGVSQGLDRLKSFLTWSANRVEPWLPAESFAQTEPDYDLAGFLYNFLPNRVAVEVGTADSEFARALSEIGYKVFGFASTGEALEKLGKEIQPDLLKIDTGNTDLEVTKDLASVRPAVVQIEFSREDLVKKRKNQKPVVSAAEKIKAMCDLEYYWNIIMFRVDSEDFVRMATNLAGTPKQSWGKIFFFQDYQLFLKAHHWCKGALPRFRASALPRH
jgi:division protein CdvB (Snf7/Vps24/ESCRT-III family)